MISQPNAALTLKPDTAFLILLLVREIRARVGADAPAPEVEPAIDELTGMMGALTLAERADLAGLMRLGRSDADLDEWTAMRGGAGTDPEHLLDELLGSRAGADVLAAGLARFGLTASNVLDGGLEDARGRAASH